MEEALANSLRLKMEIVLSSVQVTMERLTMLGGKCYFMQAVKPHFQVQWPMLAHLILWT